MSRLTIIAEQTEATRLMTKKLIREVPEELWYEMPTGIASNIAWQVGHLIVSEVYHAITVITGMNEKIRQEIPLREYAMMYAMGSQPATRQASVPTPAQLKEQLDFTHQIAQEELSTLSEEDLDEPLVPTKFTHPVAKTKYEALMWNFRHESWHGGQIAMIRRAIGRPVTWM